MPLLAYVWALFTPEQESYQTLFWTSCGLTFVGLLGLATPNFLLALVMMYLANEWFGTSIGGLVDPEYIDQPLSWGKFVSVLEHLWILVVMVQI